MTCLVSVQPQAGIRLSRLGYLSCVVALTPTTRGGASSSQRAPWEAKRAAYSLLSTKADPYFPRPGPFVAVHSWAQPAPSLSPPHPHLGFCLGVWAPVGTMWPGAFP